MMMRACRRTPTSNARPRRSHPLSSSRAACKLWARSCALISGGPRSPLLAAPRRWLSGEPAELPTALEGLGWNAFTDDTAQKYFNADTFSAYKAAQRGEVLSKEQKNAMAAGLQQWAMERGAVNYAHWFSPTRGSMAEKHDAFVDLNYSNGDLVVTFTGEQLFQGETDGSSFPNGGLRATHTAAAYTAWDVTSRPFVREDTLYIPAAFVTWHGEPLDDKTPLLRSQDAVNRESLRLLKLLGYNDVGHVTCNVGWEQEFFLVDRDSFLERPDLVACGRTLFGALPNRGQQLDTNYFARIPLRVRACLREAQAEIWQLGISLSVFHNEVAPGQHEFSPIFGMTSLAADQNQVACEILHEVAARHGLAALLHEKPFAGINGSGKHNNWGLNTDTGANLYRPGKTPQDQARFMAMTAALARALDVHGDLLRIGVSSAGNDHRLGAQEAPPAVISLYTGEHMHSHIKQIMSGGALEGYTEESASLSFGTTAIQPIAAAKEDRNRTAPFPFCGNRFEFRAVGSTANIAFPLTLLHVGVADSFKVLSDSIEGGASPRDAVAEMFTKHDRVIFNGNGYDPAWVTEAEGRGIWHLRTTVDALKELDSPKNKQAFSGLGVLSEQGLSARREIMTEQYITTLRMEATTLLNMLHTGIVPAVMEDADDTQLCGVQSYAQRRSELRDQVVSGTMALQAKHDAFPEDATLDEQAAYARDELKGSMDEVRAVVDRAEVEIKEELWPFPSYNTLLHNHQYSEDQTTDSY